MPLYTAHCEPAKASSRHTAITLTPRYGTLRIFFFLKCIWPIISYTNVREFCDISIRSDLLTLMEQSFFQSAGVYCYNEFQIPILNSYITVTSKKKIEKKEKFVTFVS